VLAIAPGRSSLGAAHLDATTGEFFLSEWDGPGRWDRLRDDIGATLPRELLLPRSAELPSWLLDEAQPESRIPRSVLDDRAFDPRAAQADLLAHFETASLAAFGCDGRELGTAAAGAVLRYVRETQKRALDHVTGLTARLAGDALVLDSLTRRNLELVLTDSEIWSQIPGGSLIKT